MVGAYVKFWAVLGICMLGACSVDTEIKDPALAAKDGDAERNSGDKRDKKDGDEDDDGDSNSKERIPLFGDEEDGGTGEPGDDPAVDADGLTDDAGDDAGEAPLIDSFRIVDAEGNEYPEIMERADLASGTVEWQASGEGSCTLSENAVDTGVAGLTGTFSFTDRTESADYLLSCSDAAGESTLEKTVKVKIWETPVVTLELEDKNNVRHQTVAASGGADVDVVWSATKATDCELFERGPADAAPGTSLAVTGVTGVHTVVNFSRDRIYTVICDNTVESHTETAQAEVTLNYLGMWHQLEGDTCDNLCADIGRVSTPSPEGFLCTSGESIPVSAVGLIDYNYGSSSARYTNGSSASDGRFCYKPGQKDDNDGSDRTVGCFCK